MTSGRLLGSFKGSVRKWQVDILSSLRWSVELATHGDGSHANYKPDRVQCAIVGNGYSGSLINECKGGSHGGTVADDPGNQAGAPLTLCDNMPCMWAAWTTRPARFVEVRSQKAYLQPAVTQRTLGFEAYGTLEIIE